MMDEIIPGLWVGNWQAAKKSTGMHVITVAIDSPFIGHEHFKLVDGPGNMRSEFDSAVRATCLAWGPHKGPVLVHCVSGRSRSCAVVVAAVALIRGIGIPEAYDLLISKRDSARIHPHLAELILEWTPRP